MNKSFVLDADVSLLQKAFVTRLRSGYATHSERWLAQAYATLHGSEWDNRRRCDERLGIRSIKNGIPTAWPPLGPNESYRYIAAGDGLPCATLMLRFENSQQWRQVVSTIAGCDIAPSCMQRGKVINPQLSAEKWYSQKKSEFISNFRYVTRK